MVRVTGLEPVRRSTHAPQTCRKVILLAKIWHADFPLANRIPIIPVLTALACLFLAAFLYK